MILELPHKADPVAMARQIARCRPGSPEDELLQQNYSRLSPGDQLRCRAELHACIRARRGEVIAEIQFVRSEQHISDK